MKMTFSLDSLAHDASLHIGHAHLVHDRFSAILNFLQNTLFAPVPTDSVQIAQKRAHKVSGPMRSKFHRLNFNSPYRSAAISFQI